MALGGWLTWRSDLGPPFFSPVAFLSYSPTYFLAAVHSAKPPVVERHRTRNEASIGILNVKECV